MSGVNYQPRLPTVDFGTAAPSPTPDKKKQPAQHMPVVDFQIAKPTAQPTPKPNVQPAAQTPQKQMTPGNYNFDNQPDAPNMAGADPSQINPQAMLNTAAGGILNTAGTVLGPIGTVMQKETSGAMQGLSGAMTPEPGYGNVENNLTMPNRYVKNYIKGVNQPLELSVRNAIKAGNLQPFEDLFVKNFPIMAAFANSRMHHMLGPTQGIDPSQFNDPKMGRAVFESILETAGDPFNYAGGLFEKLGGALIAKNAAAITNILSKDSTGLMGLFRRALSKVVSDPDRRITFKQPGINRIRGIQQSEWLNRSSQAKSDAQLLQKYEPLLKTMDDKTWEELPVEHPLKQRLMQEPYRYGDAKMREKALQMGYKPTPEDLDKFKEPEGVISYRLRGLYFPRMGIKQTLNKFLDDEEVQTYTNPTNIRAAAGNFQKKRTIESSSQIPDVEGAPLQLFKNRLVSGRAFTYRGMVAKRASAEMGIPNKLATRKWPDRDDLGKAVPVKIPRGKYTKSPPTTNALQEGGETKALPKPPQATRPSTHPPHTEPPIAQTGIVDRKALPPGPQRKALPGATEGSGPKALPPPKGGLPKLAEGPKPANPEERDPFTKKPPDSQMSQYVREGHEDSAADYISGRRGHYGSPQSDEDVWGYNPMKWISQLGKDAYVGVSPLGHSKNIATLGYLAGGVGLVAAGLRYAMMDDPPEALLKEMHHYGAMSASFSGSRSATAETLRGIENLTGIHTPVTPPKSTTLVPKEHAGATVKTAAASDDLITPSTIIQGWRDFSSSGVDRVDIGMRAAYWEHLTKMYPKMDGWEKARMVDDDLGPYGEVSQITKWMGDFLGAEFPQWKLGVVPAVGTRALLTRPQRISNYLRTESNLNQGSGTEQQSGYDTTAGTPIDELGLYPTAAASASQGIPAGILASPSAVGPVVSGIAAYLNKPDKYKGDFITNMLGRIGEQSVFGHTMFDAWNDAYKSNDTNAMRRIVMAASTLQEHNIPSNEKSEIFSRMVNEGISYYDAKTAADKEYRQSFKRPRF